MLLLKFLLFFLAYKMNLTSKGNKYKEGVPYTGSLNALLTKTYLRVFKKANKTEGEAHSTGHNLQSEILNWLFSLDLATRIKICSLENKHLGNILHQMFILSNFDTKIKFKIRQNNEPEETDEIFPVPIYFHSPPISWINFSNFNKSENSNPNNYTYYFSTSNSCQTNIVLNNFLKNNDNNEKELLREVKFYKCEEDNDTITLSSNLLSDEKKFRDLFTYFTNNKFFTSLIDPDMDVFKLNTFLPSWFKSKSDHFSFCQIIVAIFEQLIVVWFYFYKFLGEKKFQSLLPNLVCDRKFTSLLEDLEKVIIFLRKRLSKNEEKRKLLEEINFRKISTSLRKDQKVAEAINIKKKMAENIYSGLYSNRYYQSPYDKRSSSEILEEVENHFRNILYVQNTETFIESLLFTTFDKIYTYFDFFGKQIYNEIHNIYTKENAMNLITELEETMKIKPVSTKRNKNSKKRKSKNKDEFLITNPILEEIQTTELKDDLSLQLENNECRLKEDNTYSKENINPDTMDYIKTLFKSFIDISMDKITEKEKLANLSLNKSSKKEKTNKIFLYTKNSLSNKNNQSKTIKSLQNGKDKIPLESDIVKESEKIQIESIVNEEIPPIKLSSLQSSNENSAEDKNIQITINSPIYNNYYIINPPNTRSSLNSLNSFNMMNTRSFFPRSDEYSSHNYLFCPPQSYNTHLQLNLLHNDIVKYSRDVSDNVMALKSLKLLMIKKIQDIIKEALPEYKICLNLYGSFATDLEIESSDIDITVRYCHESVSSHQQSYLGYNYSVESVINKLVKTFKTKNIFEIVNPIYTASVPVIKLQLDLEESLETNEMVQIFKESPNYSFYKFNRDELDKVRIDLTFLDANKNNMSLINRLNSFESPSQQAVEFVKNFVLCFPEIRPLILVLKRLLQLEKLNSSFNGGMSSFGLFLIIFAFLKLKKCNPNYLYSANLGNLLLDFLDFYSNFNFVSHFIDVNSPNPFITASEVLDQVPLILDPITYLNVGKSSYRIEEVKQVFAKTYNSLYNIVTGFQYISDRNTNSIYFLFNQIKLIKG